MSRSSGADGLSCPDDKGCRFNRHPWRAVILPYVPLGLRDSCAVHDAIIPCAPHIESIPPVFPVGDMEGLLMSTPEKHEPDRTPQQDQSQLVKEPDQQNGEKKAETLGDVGDNTMNLATKSEKKQGWKGIG